MTTTTTCPTVMLRPGHVQPVWAGHPWVYAQAIERVTGGAVPGCEVEVQDPQGKLLGRGFYSPRSAIPVRILTRDRDHALDGAFFRERLRRAIALRRSLSLPSGETDAFRLVHAEGDGLPGLVVDLYAGVAVLQATTLGMRQRLGVVIDALRAELGVKAVFDRTPEEAARLEGFELGERALLGDAPEVLSFVERGFRYELPATLGQKTGFYFDQRPLRARVEQLSRGRTVLDAYSFIGTFSLAAARGGAAEVVAVDESAVALEVAAEVARKNDLAGRISHVRGDAREALARAGREGGHDLVICDPPKLSPTRASRDAALVGYRKLAAQACRATRPGGLLVFCSCSAAVGVDALTRALALGAVDAGRSVAVLERHFQGADHPVPAAFPEGLYLKSLLARVDLRS